MGACAGKPKKPEDGTLPPEPLPTEEALPKKNDVETVEVAQEKEVGDEKQEAPLADLSEPKQEVEDSSSEEKVDETIKAVTTAEDKAEAVVVPETKVEETPKAEAVVVPERKLEETPKAEAAVVAELKVDETTKAVVVPQQVVDETAKAITASDDKAKAAI